MSTALSQSGYREDRALGANHLVILSEQMKFVLQIFGNML